ncbi:phage tail tape measure protein [Orenia marismortui]|uniref:phage tail tape measure protein n=1 Tax=Orenia marismortui TaxID=46469 RepID=UPI0003679ADD|nr:phage tail tape measure protein [Orenia marismortui]
MDATHNLGIGISSFGVNDVLSDLNRMKKSINDITKTTKTANDIIKNSTRNTSRSVKEVNNAFKKQSKIIGDNRKQINNTINSTSKLNNSVKETKKQTEGIHRQYNKLAKSFFNVALWSATSGVIFGVANSLKEVKDTIIEIDSNMINLNKILDVGESQLNSYKKAAVEMGDEFATQIDKVINIQEEWSRLGRRQGLTELADVSLMAQNISNLSSVESVKMLNAALNQFDIEINQANTVLDQWNELSNNSSASTRDLAESVSRAGIDAKTAGISLEELNAITSTLKDNLGDFDGSQIGNALKTIFSRSKSSKFGNELQKIGIAIRSSSGEYRSFMSVLEDLNKVYDSLNDVQQESISLALGGRRRIGIVKNLLQDFNKVSEYTEIALNSNGSALREQEKALQSISKQWEKAIAKFDKVAISLGDSGLKSIMLNLTKGMQSSLDAINDIIVGFGEMGTGGKLLISILGTAGLVSVLIKLTNTIRNATITAAAFKSIMTPTSLLIGSLITGITLYSLKLGEEKRATEKLIEVKKILNKVRKEGATLSKSEYTTAKEEVENLKNKMEKLKKATEEYYNALNQPRGVVLDPVAAASSSSRQLQKLKKELKTIFPEFKDINDPKKIIEELSKVYSELNTKLSSNIAYQSESAKKVFDSAMSRKEQLAQLKHQIEAWKNLNIQINSNQDLTQQQKQRYKTFTEILKGQYQQLKGLSNGDFANELNNILNTQTNSTSKMVEDAKDKLLSYKSDWTEILDNLKQEYNQAINKSLSEGTNIRFAQNLNKDLKDRMDTVKQYITNINTQLDSLDRDVVFQEFLISSEEKFKIFKDGVYANLIDPLQKFKDELSNINKTYKASIEGLNIKDKLFNLDKSDYNKQLKQILDNRVDSLITLSADLKIENFADVKEKLNDEINEALSNTNISEERKTELEQLQGEINKTGRVSQLRADILNTIKSTKSELDKVNKKIELEQFKNDIDSATKSYQNQEKQIKATIQQLEEYKKLAENNGLDTTLLNKGIKLEQGKLKLPKITEQIEDLNKVVNQFDKEKYQYALTIPNKEIKKINSQLDTSQRLKEELDNLYNNGFISKETFNQTKKDLYTMKKDTKYYFDWLKEHTGELRKQLTINIADGIADGFADVDTDEITNKWKRFIEGLGNSLSNILQNELASNIIGKKLADMNLFGSDASAGQYASAIQQVGSSIKKSTGEMLSTSIGMAVGTMLGSPEIGAALGSMQGSIFSSLFGSDKGEDPSLVKNLKKQVEEARNFLSDFNLEEFIPKVDAEDRSSAWGSFWGSTDWVIKNYESVTEALEEIYPRIKQTISSLSSGLNDALASSISYSELYSSWESTIGKALRNSLLSTITDSSQYKEMVGRITEATVNASQDMYISDKELANIKEIYESSKSDLGDYYDQVQGVVSEFGLDTDVDNSTSTTQSFSAGSSTSMTFNNSAHLHTNLFMGTDLEMRETVDKLLPYIQEGLSREAGN